MFCHLCFVVPSNSQSCKWSLSVMLSSQTAAVARIPDTSVSASLPWRPEIFICFLCVWVEAISNWLTTQHTSSCSKHSCKLQLILRWERYELYEEFLRNDKWRGQSERPKRGWDATLSPVSRK